MNSRFEREYSLRFIGAVRKHRPSFLCAEHVRQLGGESPLLNLMEVKVREAQGASSRGRGLTEARKRGAKARADEQEPDTRNTVPGELASDNKAHIHQGRWL